jgi:hypothetical protein
MLRVWGSRKGGQGCCFNFLLRNINVLSEAEFLDVLGTKVLRDASCSPSGMTEKSMFTNWWWRSIFLEREVRVAMRVDETFLSAHVDTTIYLFGAKFIISINTFSCVKKFLKFSFNYLLCIDNSSLLDHCFKYIYWHLSDLRQIVFFVILFPVFRIFALFTSYFLSPPRGSMWWWTAVEIYTYIFLVLTPRRRIDSLSLRSVVTGVLTYCRAALLRMHSPFCTEQI